MANAWCDATTESWMNELILQRRSTARAKFSAVSQNCSPLFSSPTAPSSLPLRSLAELYEEGRTLRNKCPRQSHGVWKAPRDRSDPVCLMQKTTFATRAAESGMDLPTLTALLGQSKIQMVMRYAHPTALHQADSMKRLEIFNAAKEITEVERKKRAEKEASAKTVPTVSLHSPRNKSLKLNRA
jgi:hypothetical protein